MFTTSPSIVSFGKAAATFIQGYYSEDCDDENTLEALSLEAVELPAWVFLKGDVVMYNTMSHSVPICIYPEQHIINTFGLFSLFLMPRHFMDDFENNTVQFTHGIRAALEHLKVGNIVTDLEIMTAFNEPEDTTTGQVSALVIDVCERLDKAWTAVTAASVMTDATATTAASVMTVVGAKTIEVA
jgi:hypothetical protein